MDTTTAVQGSAIARVCEHPDCSIELTAKNRSGRCSKHFHWKGTGKARPSRSNGHAAAGSNGANGHPRTAENDSVEQSVAELLPDPSRNLVESRVEWLFANMPIADKTKIAAAWLRGEI